MVFCDNNPGLAVEAYILLSYISCKEWEVKNPTVKHRAVKHHTFGTADGQLCVSVISTLSVSPSWYNQNHSKLVCSVLFSQGLADIKHRANDNVYRNDQQKSPIEYEGSNLEVA